MRRVGTPGPATLGRLIDAGPRHFRPRLETLLGTWDLPHDGRTAELLDTLAHHLAGGDRPSLWLALAVLSGELPDQATVRRASRQAALDGPLAALTGALARRWRQSPGQRSAFSDAITVVTDRVVLDLPPAPDTPAVTGSQRVAHEVARRWEAAHDVVRVVWAGERHALALPAGDEGAGRIVVPWRCTYLVPALHWDAGHVGHFQALARYSGNRTAVIGYDGVPMAADEMEDGSRADFHVLAALAHVDRIAAISEGSAADFVGWRSMLAGAGLRGPDIAPIALPADPARPDARAAALARDRFVVGSLPLVLVAGSLTPRTNHRAALHAAELLWRQGLEFSVLVAGDGTVQDAGFSRLLHELQAGGRPVHAITDLRDDLRAACYALARCTVFPSLHERFAQPVADALAWGTPVITSDFGSMRELGLEAGALLVDPRDPGAIADALRRLLTDDALHAALSHQARTRPVRTWEQYADETWAYFGRELVGA